MIVPACIALGCLVGLAWSSAQAEVPEVSSVSSEPPRDPAAPVALVLVASDGSTVSDTIDRVSGGRGFSHCYLDVGHRLPDGSSLIVDYQPGAGVHYARDTPYHARGRARIDLEGAVGEQIWGCVRARLGQPFDAAGALLGKTTTGTCSGLLWSCLPPALRDALGASGRQIAPNDLARAFGAVVGRTVRYQQRGG